MPESVPVRLKAFEPVQVFELASPRVPAKVSEPVPVPVSGLVQALVSELEQEPASAREQGRIAVLVQRAWLWEGCPYLFPCLCLSRWQRCKSVRARRL